MNSSRIGAALRWLSTARRNDRLIPTNQSTQVRQASGAGTRQAEHVIVYRGLTEADDGRQSYGKGHFPPLLSAHGVLTPAQVCALRTQRMLEVDGVPRSALEALVQASYYHAQRNPDAVGYGRPLDHE